MSGEGYEESLLRRHNEMAVLIGHALRRAAGLPDEDDPFIERRDETHLPGISLVASHIIVASYGKAPVVRTPKAMAKTLKDIRKKSQYLRAQIAQIDGETRSTINRAGSAEHAALKDLPEDASEDEILRAGRAVGTVPREQWTVPAVLIAMDRLEDALTSVIGYATDLDARSPDPKSPKKRRTKPPNYAKQGVAMVVWQYLKDATGDAPKLWPDDAPSEPWNRGESSEPFAVALREIFKILGFKPGIQAAGDYATSKL